MCCIDRKERRTAALAGLSIALNRQQHGHRSAGHGRPAIAVARGSDALAVQALAAHHPFKKADGAQPQPLLPPVREGQAHLLD